MINEKEEHMDIKLIQFSPHGDDRGQLVALEETREIPFPIKRVYYMYKTVPDAVRGKHAHRKLEQVLACFPRVYWCHDSQFAIRGKVGKRRVRFVGPYLFSGIYRRGDR